MHLTKTNVIMIDGHILLFNVSLNNLQQQICWFKNMIICSVLYYYYYLQAVGAKTNCLEPGTYAVFMFNLFTTLALSKEPNWASCWTGLTRIQEFNAQSDHISLINTLWSKLTSGQTMLTISSLSLSPKTETWPLGLCPLLAGFYCFWTNLLSLNSWWDQVQIWPEPRWPVNNYNCQTETKCTGQQLVVITFQGDWPKSFQM